MSTDMRADFEQNFYCDSYRHRDAAGRCYSVFCRWIALGNPKNYGNNGSWGINIIIVYIIQL